MAAAGMELQQPSLFRPFLFNFNRPIPLAELAFPADDSV
jgi:hypothetical protein